MSERGRQAARVVARQAGRQANGRPAWLPCAACPHRSCLASCAAPACCPFALRFIQNHTGGLPLTACLGRYTVPIIPEIQASCRLLLRLLVRLLLCLLICLLMSNSTAQWLLAHCSPLSAGHARCRPRHSVYVSTHATRPAFSLRRHWGACVAALGAASAPQIYRPLCNAPAPSGACYTTYHQGLRCCPIEFC